MPLILGSIGIAWLLVLTYIITRLVCEVGTSDMPLSVPSLVRLLEASKAQPQFAFAPSEEVRGNSAELQQIASDTTIKVCPCSRAHVFYYAWFGAPPLDPKYVHWNHGILPPPWAGNVEGPAHDPSVGDIGANFWPKLGAYASRNSDVVANHMRAIADACIGVVVVSWYPPGIQHENGLPSDAFVSLLLEAAHVFNLTIALHLEPYFGRSAGGVSRDIEYALRRYGSHPALFRAASPWSDGAALPWFYVYDAQHIAASEWRKLLKPGPQALRAGPYDCVVVGLAQPGLVSAGFDGFYPYFGSQSEQDWPQWASTARREGAFFAPSVAPGYDDAAVRPWNAKARVERENGTRYRRQWRAALDTGVPVVTITSFNEWHEGTQIEAAVPQHSSRQYEDYGELGPDGYLTITREFACELCAHGGLKT